MENLFLINKNVSDALKEENNEITYKAWLLFTENAQFIENDIIVMVPNQFIKNIIEERYLPDIEELYRKEVDFNQLFIKVQGEQEVKIETSNLFDSFAEQVSNKFDEIIETINNNVKNIYEFIEAASKNGSSSVCYTLIQEPVYMEEIYGKVKEFMLNKGFRAEFCKMDSNYALNIYW